MSALSVCAVCAVCACATEVSGTCGVTGAAKAHCWASKNNATTASAQTSLDEKRMNIHCRHLHQRGLIPHESTLRRRIFIFAVGKFLLKFSSASRRRAVGTAKTNIL